MEPDQPVLLWGPADDAAAAALAAALDADAAPLDADEEAAAAWCSRRAKLWSAETAGAMAAAALALSGTRSQVRARPRAHTLGRKQKRQKFHVQKQYRA